MNAASAANYRARFRKVLEFIDANPDGELTADRLCGLAAFSKYHFHRQFSALFGIGVYQYVQLSRLKRASWQLAFRSELPVTDIALANGYDGPEAFARAFRRLVGQAPSAFRKQPQWSSWHAAFQPLCDMRSDHMQPDHQPGQVRIIHFNETRIAVLAHRGDPRLVGNSVRDFIAWRKQNRLPPAVSATYNILYDDPSEVAPQDFRIDLCAAIERGVEDNPFGVTCARIPAGRCAVLRHIGSDNTLAGSIRYLFSDWLPHSGEELRDFPLFLQRVTFFPDVPENAAITDIFLPLRESYAEPVLACRAS